MGESLPDGMKGGYISLQRTNTRITLTVMLVKICIQKRNEEHQHGVIVYYGTAVAFSNYHMFVGSLGSRITGPCTVYFWQKSSPSTAVASRKTWLTQAQELRLKKCCHMHMHMDIFNQISSKWNSHLASSARVDLVMKHEISHCLSTHEIEGDEMMNLDSLLNQLNTGEVASNIKNTDIASNN